MNILPKTGIDKIRLGMSKQEITKLLGQPISTESNPDDDIWEFKNDIELSFHKDDDYLLTSITVFSPLALLKSKNIIGISEAEFFSNFPAFQLDEDFGGNGKSYWSDEMELMAWLFEGDVFNITIFPEYTDNDTAIWPKTDI